MAGQPPQSELQMRLTRIISETNGISLLHTLELASHSILFHERPQALALVQEFRSMLFDYAAGRTTIEPLLDHAIAKTLGRILRRFPKPFREEHIHLTGSLTADFIYPRLMVLLDGPHGDAYRRKIVQVYGEEALPITCEADVDRLIRASGSVSFTRYLHMLTLAKLVLVDREAHEEAAYHMASELYNRHNVGLIRLKFSITRLTTDDIETLPGAAVSAEDVVLGLHEGFMRFRREQPGFDFVLSPSFRKEASFYDATRFSSKRDFFMDNVQTILGLIERYPFLTERLTDVDTVGDERHHYRKVHFDEMRLGMRKLQFRGIRIRSHHGETWTTLNRGVQAVDNAMNIWHIDVLEHGVSLGVNPNYYLHMVFERAMEQNMAGRPLPAGSAVRNEVCAMHWDDNTAIRDKLVHGDRLTVDQIRRFVKTKFHAAREVEYYQHDVLNRMINKGVSLVSLPSSNVMLTPHFPRHRDHPFSWWEKKGLELGVGTDNYVTLNTNFVREMLILLCNDMENLKLTKLLMVVTGETRRPTVSRLLWSIRD